MVKYLFILLLYCGAVQQMSSAQIVSKTSLLLLSDDGPPHMIKVTKSGIDIDITREVIESMGEILKIEFSPLKRNQYQVMNKQADMFVPTFYQQDTKQLFISDPIIQYRPTVFSLKDKQLNFTKLADIKNKKVITFQGALGYFGAEFIKMSKQNDYREIHDMSKLPEMLMARRVDVIVLDYYIFYYFLKQSGSIKLGVTSAVNEHKLIPEVNAHVGFNSEALRNKFNKYLKTYIHAKRDIAVINNYIGMSKEQ